MHQASWTSHAALTVKYNRHFSVRPPISLQARANGPKQTILKYDDPLASFSLSYPLTIGNIV